MSAMPKLEWRTAIKWISRDERDDFFPDVIRYRDIAAFAENYLALNDRKLFQYSKHPFDSFTVPKSHLLKRQAICLPFPFRLVYTALLRELFYEISPYLSPNVHSYRMYGDVNHDEREYPFPSESTKYAWLGFKHGFNAALHQDDGWWGVETDITMFFEQIDVRNLISVLSALIPADRLPQAEPCLQLLENTLLWCSRQGRGVPQNYDASSFFCSAFLTPVDREMSRLEQVHYTRWMDDIRIAAPTRGGVIRALHKLQDELARYGLGINSRKTKLLEPGSRDYSNYLAVDEDVRLQSLSDTVASHHENTIREALPLFIRAIKECDQNGNDRFLRAYGARLLEAAEFEELRVEALNAIRGFALGGFRDRPERADQWCKFLSPNVTPEVQTYICDFLDDANYNCHEWTNFWAMVTLCRAKDPIQKVTELFRRMAFGAASTPIRSHAIAAYGRISDTIDRRKLADAYLTGEISPALRRACIVGIQQLPIDIRTQYFDRAKQIDPDLTTLIDYLGSKESPTYGAYTFPTRHCTPEPEEQAPPKQMGVGFVGGTWNRFPIRPRYYPDYE